MFGPEAPGGAGKVTRCGGDAHTQDVLQRGSDFLVLALGCYWAPGLRAQRPSSRAGTVFRPLKHVTVSSGDTHASQCIPCPRPVICRRD